MVDSCPWLCMWGVLHVLSIIAQVSSCTSWDKLQRPTGRGWVSAHGSWETEGCDSHISNDRAVKPGMSLAAGGCLGGRPRPQRGQSASANRSCDTPRRSGGGGNGGAANDVRRTADTQHTSVPLIMHRNGSRPHPTADGAQGEQQSLSLLAIT